MGFSLWLVTVGWEILALPITHATLRGLKQGEQAYFFDTGHFNPFVMASESENGKQVVSRSSATPSNHKP
jgi:hypothetical protein